MRRVLSIYADVSVNLELEGDFILVASLKTFKEDVTVTMPHPTENTRPTTLSYAGEPYSSGPSHNSYGQKFPFILTGGKCTAFKGPFPRKPIKPRANRKKRRESFAIYIYRILKQIHSDETRISKAAIGIIDNFIMDLFDRLCEQSLKLMMMHKRRTLTFREVETSTKLILTGELAHHAIRDAQRAKDKYWEISHKGGSRYI